MTGPDASPFLRFHRWLDEARLRERRWAAVMTLATVAANGRPSCRSVLMTDWDERGVVFFTDDRSRKAGELAGNPWAAAVFLWPASERQVRVEGRVAPLSSAPSDPESDRRFGTTPRQARLAVWAARQGEVIPDREVLERLVEEAEGRFGDEVPRPPWWRAYRLDPVAFEFWESRPDALHDRLRHHRLEDGSWAVERLAP
jgi:pyridoxamine 5'-phosphate oxidase